MFLTNTPLGNEIIQVLIKQAFLVTFQEDISHAPLLIAQPLFLFKEENDFAFMHLAGLRAVFKERF